LTILTHCLLIAAVLTDLLSLVLGVRRAIKGQGASGIPVLPWLVYYFLTEWLHQSFMFGSPFRAIIAFTILHVSCQYLIPLALRIDWGQSSK